MKRFDCLKLLLPMIDPKTITVTSFRGNGEEWSYLRGNKLNFYGLNMGLCTPVAVGVAAAQPQLKVVALDSDGSFLLDVGVLVTIATLNLKNLIVIVFDNEKYGPYGSTATSDTIALENLAKSVGIGHSTEVRDLDSFKKAVDEALHYEGTSFIVAKVEMYTEQVPGPYRRRNGRMIKEEFYESVSSLVQETQKSR